MQTDLTFAWDKSPASAAAAASFAAAIIGQDTAYISHGEIQTGLSIDGAHWAPDLARLYASDFADFGEERDLLIARTPDGSIAGIAILAWEESSRRRFAVLEDMVVAPLNRSSGVGGQLVRLVEERVKERGVAWLFLESGLRNERAHQFFEREGFHMTGHVFVKQIEP
ncbi:GNAT family N-acetyltransferase [Sphingomonas sanxanigenens]|uniref:N-acetyltransferase domain-containing protein n=1 Tax=Sphingomonas sanxanigenens DSM 19645 = NX02 TaxID=1123269 RepID=W0ACB8_9SPHN|nr:GNAT family N-acetyltransferase [Sphingomonas sanxanigenens]AHE53325.1 hypothetical protein NX02_08005 [Sphingomonas sanxanigenens DSM 19645 = NX02]